ncbi:hypothetical protein WK76_24895 [Burkholderia ubonensis]|uniref:metallophosphoesterase n=1 Tax=Burkholderia ubonensis TaxID=101571 RepID=UPI000754E41A|nr:metallophosphoesterase [Burkholderia ubonensis]KVU84269.1 hypothetical protein WK76_24895 [Burkholderia ubonensis]
MRIKHFAENSHGCDFAVGDIHGCFSELEAQLLRVNFDPAVDRLFCVGDLVDRGPESHRVLEFLALPWFFSVRGNHEQMAIQFAAFVNDMTEIDLRGYYDDGGGWLMNLSPASRARVVGAFERLPVALDVRIGNRLVGIVHADCPMANWDAFDEVLSESDPGTSRLVDSEAMWSRTRIQQDDHTPVAGLDALIVGHTPLRKPTRLGNVNFIDTGACYPGGTLTVMNLTEAIEGSARTYRRLS